MTGNMNNLFEVGTAREGDVGPVSAGGGENEPRVSRLATASFWIGCIPSMLWTVAVAWAVAALAGPTGTVVLGLAVVCWGWRTWRA